MKKKFAPLLLTVPVIFLLLFTSCADRAGSKGSDTGNSEQTQNNADLPLEYTIIYFDVAQNKKMISEESFHGGAEFMLSRLVERISDLTGQKIDYNHIENDGNGGITVDFKADGSPASGVGSAGEAAILDSITETVFENYPEIQGVFFTCDGGAYSSGHVQLEAGEAYRMRQNDEKA